jgi:hypothetical protein
MFKVGDWVKIKRNCSGSEAGKIYKLKFRHYDELYACIEDGERGCSCKSNWILVNRDLENDFILNLINNG